MPQKLVFMDLGTGVGITGILISKYTRVIMKDYNSDVLDNTWINVKLNQSQCILMQLDWRNHSKISFQLDLIVGSDLVYQGIPLYDLYQTILKLLSMLQEYFLEQNGKFYLIIPSNRMCTSEFIEIMNSEGLFEIQKELLEDEKYYKPCLQDEEQSQQLYPGLKELQFQMYIFIKK
ncbi:unnamed protein product [Paramecium sonneborni]|uniref:Uncharacterized protein n=1 Tax=Paramecium sonneborni TaxID=65129 RepID=A0A8S1M9S7_9CILI|nr:unnamed protein product [Paramecium sonneborni]